MVSESSGGDGDALRDVALDLARRELEIARENRYPGQTSGDLAAVVRLAWEIGVRVTDIAARAGLTRPTIYDLINGERGQPFDDYALRIAVAIYLAAKGMTTPQEVASKLKIEVVAALVRLRLLTGEGQAREGVVGSGATAQRVFVPSGKMQEFLEDRLLVVGDTRDSAYAFYFEVSEEEITDIERAADRLLGREQQTLIAAYVSSAMRLPELAVSLNADDDRHAFVIATGIWRDILKEARIKPRPPSIALALPPRRRARS